jgi:flagellar P-ring protein precursor FlgI
MRRWLLIIAVLGSLAARPAAAARLKDLADLRGARDNQLLGYGLVVGLGGTGDDMSANISVQSVVTMLQKLGVRVDVQYLRLRNVAAVIVTADLPPFIAAGQRIDVTVSSVGNALSLEGGTLLLTPLKGADTKVYAVAQGPVSVGGYLVQAQTGSRLSKNQTTVGRIPGGALVEREVPLDPGLATGDQIEITLKSPDFTTAVRIADAIRQEVEKLAPTAAATAAVVKAAGGSAPPGVTPAGPGAEGQADAATGPLALARDAGTVVVRVPEAYRTRQADLVAALEGLNVQPDVPTRVIVNERTGTVVLGDGVRLAPVAIAHGGLTLEVRETPTVSQPAPFTKGKTTVVPRSGLSAAENPGELKALAAGASLGDVVKALNALGVTPRDLVAILQALKAAGALEAELEVQ